MVKFNKVIVVLSFAIGCMSGYIAADSSQEKTMLVSMKKDFHGISEQESAPRHSVVVYPLDKDKSSAELTSAIREVIHTELEAFLANPHITRNTGEVKSVPARDPQEIRAAVERANTILASAMSLGVWDESSDRSYREALGSVTGSEWDEAMSKLTVAINNGELNISRR